MTPIPSGTASESKASLTGLSRMPWRLAIYLVVAIAVTWPAATSFGSAVPGAERTDIYNALWSLWFVSDAVGSGQLPWHTSLLDPPTGGTLLVADPLNALLGLPLIQLLGVARAYSLLVVGHITLAGWAAHRLTRSIALELKLPAEAAGLIAGVGYATAPVLRAAIHNGSSESVSGGLAVLAAWACFRVARDGGWLRAVLAGFALFLAALGSWYGGVAAFLFGVALLVMGLPGRWRSTVAPRVGAVVLGAMLVLPLAALVRSAASADDNLVRIKHPRELMTVRRTTGPADIRGYVLPGDFRSPDFRAISRYGEQFFHCHYLGWTLILGALLALRRRPGTGWLWLAGLSGLLLSLGPVAVRDGAAWIVLGDRAIPLPYYAVETLPGFNSLSLLYRLAQAPALAFSVLAGLGVAGLRLMPAAKSGQGIRRLLVAATCTLILLEGRFLVPLGSLPDTAPADHSLPLLALSELPRGVVLNHPVVGGRAYLFEQSQHHQPMAGTLNFPNNAIGMRAWRGLGLAAEQAGQGSDEATLATARESVRNRARAAGVRYVVVHDDAFARPDVQDDAVDLIERAFTPLEPSPPGSPVRVYVLW